MHRSRQISTLAAVAALGLAACSPDVTSPAMSSSARIANSVTSTGNGAPSGAHYTLNLIGVPKGKNISSASGSVIFVSLGTKNVAVTTKIMLSQSFDGSFQVLDKDGTDGVASYRLPAPGTYTIWARALGKPGDSARITTCATDVTGNGTTTDQVCSTANEVFVRGTGQSLFKNVTTNLTTIYIDPILDAAAVTACGGTTVSLFDPCLEGYFWQYDNYGLKVLQIRFYPNPT